MKKLGTVFLFNMFLLTAFSQSGAIEGFIVTNKGDTTMASIQIQSLTKYFSSCQAVIGKETTEYGPKDLQGFYFDGNYYVSGIVDNQFVKALVIGSMSLYQYKEAFYVVRNNEAPQILEKTIIKQDGTKYVDVKWKRILNFLISECQNIKKEVENVDFNDRSLSNVVLEYNDCIGGSVDYSQNLKNKFKLIFEIIPTISYSQTSLRTTSEQDFHEIYLGTSKSWNPNLGINIGFSFPSLNGAKVLTGAQFGKAELSHVNYQKFNLTGYVFEHTRDWTISYNELTVPLIIQNNIIRRKTNALFGQLGMESIMLKKAKQTIYVTRVYTYDDGTVEEFNTEFDPESTTYKIDENQFAIMAGIGAEKKIGNSYLGFLVKYSKFIGPNITSNYDQNQNFEGINASMKRISFQTQIRF